MDWKLVATSFVAIFIAELGDKTQLATMALSGSNSSKWSVFLGASLGLVATTAIGVLVGEAVTRAVPAEWITRGAGVLFIAIGAWTLYKG